MSTCFYDNGPAANGGRKVMLATTAYDSPDASYTFSIQDSRKALEAEGIKTAYLLLSGNCHVDDARNSVVHSFLESDCTDLVFLDADVSWKPGALVELCRFDCDLVGGVYPYRRSSPRAKSYEMPVRCLPDAGIEGPLLEVEGLPTGFMRIRRCVLETLAKTSIRYKTKSHDNDVALIFERTIDGDTRWGGDINFCRKWRATGGKVYAASELQLGHVGKQVINGSLGASLRRKNGVTLKYVADKIRDNTLKPHHLEEAWESQENTWAAEEDVLAFAIAMARKAKKPIIETGSGLTTVLMAAATDQTVFCIEHEPYWADRLRRMAADAGVDNIAICHAPIKNGWYDVAEMKDLPEEFSFGLNDGPPRDEGNRMAFFTHIAPKCEAVLCDDADDETYANKVEAWAAAFGWSVKAKLFRSLILEQASS